MGISISALPRQPVSRLLSCSSQDWDDTSVAAATSTTRAVCRRLASLITLGKATFFIPGRRSVGLPGNSQGSKLAANRHCCVHHQSPGTAGRRQWEKAHRRCPQRTFLNCCWGCGSHKTGIHRNEQLLLGGQQRRTGDLRFTESHRSVQAEQCQKQRVAFEPPTSSSLEPSDGLRATWALGLHRVSINPP